MATIELSNHVAFEPPAISGTSVEALIHIHYEEHDERYTQVEPALFEYLAKQNSTDVSQRVLRLFRFDVFSVSSRKIVVHAEARTQSNYTAAQLSDAVDILAEIIEEHFTTSA